MKAPMTADERNAIRARAEAATEGPWTSTFGYNNGGIATAFFAIPGHNGGGKVEMILEDAEFIAHAREDIPRLLADNDALRAEVAALLRALEWRNMLHGERNCPGCSTPEGYAHESDCALDAMIRKCEGA